MAQILATIAAFAVTFWGKQQKPSFRTDSYFLSRD